MRGGVWVDEGSGEVGVGGGVSGLAIIVSHSTFVQDIFWEVSLMSLHPQVTIVRVCICHNYDLLVCR